MRSRWLFFFLYAVLATPGRFMSIFYKAHELDDTRIGILMAVFKLVSLVAAPAVCNFADRVHKRELVAAGTYLVAIILFTVQIVALPSLELLPDNYRFEFLLVLRVLYGVFASAAYPLVSAIGIAQLRKEHGDEGHERFGQERLWGAVSWAACAMLLGFLLDLPGIGIWIVHIGVVFFGGLYIISLLTFSYVNREVAHAMVNSEIENQFPEVADEGQGSNEDDSSSKNSQVRSTSLSAATAVRKIFSQGGLSTVLFFNLIFWLAAGMSLVENLLFLFFKDDLKASNLVCGISVVVTVVFEIPLFARAPQLLQKLGAPALAIIGSTAFAIRGYGYTLVPNAWLVLIFEPLHGITYAAAHTASVAYVAERSPPELEATAQSLLGGLESLSAALGAMFGGYIMEHFGSKVLYRGGALTVILATLAFAAVEGLSRVDKGSDVDPRRIESLHSSKTAFADGEEEEKVKLIDHDGNEE